MNHRVISWLLLLCLASNSGRSGRCFASSHTMRIRPRCWRTWRSAKQIGMETYGKHGTTMDNPLNRLGVIVITLWKSNIVMENEWTWYVHESEMVHCQVWLSKSLAVNQRTGMTPGFCTVHLNLSNRIYHWQLWIIWQNPGEWLRIMEAMNKLDSPSWANWSNCWVPKKDMELTSKDNLLMAMDIWPTFACVLVLCCHFLSFLKCVHSTFFPVEMMSF